MNRSRRTSLSPHPSFLLKEESARQEHAEARSLSHAAFYLHSAAVCFDDGLDDEQAEPRALLMPSGGSAMIFFKKKGLFFWSDAGPGVPYLDYNPSGFASLRPGRDDDLLGGTAKTGSGF